MNKKGFVDAEVIMSAGFLILVAMAVTATLIGWKMSMSMDGGGWPLWQIIVIIVAEIVASYLITLRMQ